MIAAQMLTDGFEDTLRGQPNGQRSSVDCSQYNTIGETLLACEVLFWKVGVPWLFPTARVCKIYSQKVKNLDEYLRTSLVNVNTATLHAYCLDLEGINKCSDLKNLNIELESTLERYAFSLISILTSLVLCLYITDSILAEPIMALIISIFVSSLAGFAALVASTDLFRRNSFYRLIYQEILRREGIDGSDPKNKVKVLSTEANFS